MSSVSVVSLPHSILVVRLTGEFDVSNADEVATALDKAIADPASRTVAVDLSEVTFLDSTLLQALVTGRDRAQLVHKPVWLVRPPAAAWRVFAATLLDRLFRDFASLAELEAYAAATLTKLSA